MPLDEGVIVLSVEHLVKSEVPDLLKAKGNYIIQLVHFVYGFGCLKLLIEKEFNHDCIVRVEVKMLEHVFWLPMLERELLIHFSEFIDFNYLEDSHVLT